MSNSLQTPGSLPVSSVHGILQARIQEWVVFLFFRGSSLPGDWTQVSHIAGEFLTICLGKKRGLGCHFLLKRIFLTRDRTCISCIAGGFFYHWATGEAHAPWENLCNCADSPVCGLPTWGCGSWLYPISLPLLPILFGPFFIPSVVENLFYWYSGHSHR